jgi:PASTA domain
MTVCQVCGHANPDGTEFCGNCGSYLRWDGAGRLASAAVPVAAPPAEYGVRLDLAAAPAVALAPGGEQRLAVGVRNTGSVVDDFALSVAAPVDWIRVEPPSVSVYPAGEETATVVLAPPAGAAAGTVTFRLSARSSLQDRAASTVDGAVTVAPVDALSADVGPLTAIGRGRAGARVLIRNDGNRPLTVTVAQSDAGSGIRAEVSPSTVEVVPGRPVQLAVRLRPDRSRWFGQPAHLPYRLRVTARPGAQPVDLNAAMQQRPLLPWVPKAASLLVPLLALAAVLVVGLAALMMTRSGSGGQDQPPRVGVTGSPTGSGAGGPQAATVPDVAGKSLDDARSDLSDAGLRVRVSQRTDDADPGTVLVVVPAAGSELPAGSTVLLVVSAGPDETQQPTTDPTGSPSG